MPRKYIRRRHEHAPVASVVSQSVTSVPPPPAAPVTIHDVMTSLYMYLLFYYEESPVDQEAVYDLWTLYTDRNVSRAWAGLRKMVDGILNVPPGA